jgi:starch phosphorylase
MKTRTFTVIPSLPNKLSKLREIAMNMWWSWDPNAIRLFSRISPQLWEETRHNPVLFLSMLSQERLHELTKDEGFLAHLDRVYLQMQWYLDDEDTWFRKNGNYNKSLRIAYFSSEFGLNESIPIYSGGLGVLAGDHLKSASDLGLPLVGISLLYRQGYFRQYLNIDGWQQEEYPENNFMHMPLELMRNENDEPYVISVPMPHQVYAQIWRVQVGRVPLYLLDANIEQNDPKDREVTAQLYGGDQSMRIRQEILLGIGGIKALDTIGMAPIICHVNEGHAAFLSLERTKILMERESLTWPVAYEAVKASTIFTTHTPVPAGHDIFPVELVDRYLKGYYTALGLDQSVFMAMGRRDPNDHTEPFNMTMLALKFCTYCNGVSELHGEVTRKMMASAWPELPEPEIPITSLTNGIHTYSWISFDMHELLNRYLSPDWLVEPYEQSIWDRIDAIPDTELWRTHERRRERLVAFARRRLREQLSARGAPKKEIAETIEVLNPEALTIGFARRFATYKRALLLFSDTARLTRIISHTKRPVQIIFAGKAHPADNQGKEFIRQISHYSRSSRFRRSILFLEDYDMNVARYLIQGVDVWLNTPRRGLEASGTSGMKASVNGALNLRIPDGWWCEGYDGENGWVIGRGEDYTDLNEQDRIESEAIYDMLEKDIVPLFYERGSDGVPHEWVARMKRSFKTICPRFNTGRMVGEYAKRFYFPLFEQICRFSENHWQKAKQFAEWKEQMAWNWLSIRIEDVKIHNGNQFRFGEYLKVTADCFLGEIKPSDVKVEVYTGLLDNHGKITEATAIPMQIEQELGHQRYRFVGEIACQTTGRHGFSVRVVPHHEDLKQWQDMRLITWES